MSRTPFATQADIQTRYPRELAILAADETTRQVDGARVDAALQDVSTEIRAILAARYTADQLSQLDDESAGVLRMYAIDMALHRVSLSFARQSESVSDRYAVAIRRLESIAAGRGALNVLGAACATASPMPAIGDITPHEAVVVSEGRLFSRNRLRDL